MLTVEAACAELFSVGQSSKAKEHRNGFNYKIIIAGTTYLGKNLSPSTVKFLASGNAIELCQTDLSGLETECNR